MNKDTSSRVYPLTRDNLHASHSGGMTLLQYYAGQALVGYCASLSSSAPQVRADLAFDDAESMIEEYNKRYGG